MMQLKVYIWRIHLTRSGKCPFWELLDLLAMKEINSRDFFDDSEAVISNVTSADALEEEDFKPDTSDTEEEWVPKASRRA